MVFIEVFTAVFLAEMCKIIIDRYFKSKFEKQLDFIESELARQLAEAKAKGIIKSDKNENKNGGLQ